MKKILKKFKHFTPLRRFTWKGKIPKVRHVEEEDKVSSFCSMISDSFGENRKKNFLRRVSFEVVPHSSSGTEERDFIHIVINQSFNLHLGKF